MPPNIIILKLFKFPSSETQGLITGIPLYEYTSHVKVLIEFNIFTLKGKAKLPH
jgi:hypothetical protein